MITHGQASAVKMKAIPVFNPSRSLGEMPKVRQKKQKKRSKDLRFCKERTSK